MKSQNLPYRPCVGIMAINRAGQVWVGRRADMPGDLEGAGQWWQMPQGGIDGGEDAGAAAIRELREETGMRTVSIIGQTRGWFDYDLPPELLGVIWGGKFRGQRQKWFAVRFDGSDTEIDIGGHDGQPAEFEDWRWVGVNQLESVIVPFKREVYRAVVAELGTLARPL